MRKAILATFLLLIPCYCFPVSHGEEAASITVRVLDPQGAIVTGAKVTLYRRDARLRIAAVTDQSGTYRFERLAPGEYLAAVEAPGFARSNAESVRLEDGAAAVLDISLELAAFTEQVVVIASATAQAVDEVSKAVTVVDEQDIDERDEYSIPEALRTVPGLRVQQLGGPGALTSIKVRGLRNEHTAVLVDGVRLRDAAATQGDATAFMELLNSTALDRVEILRGSGSSLYGSHGIGGVINIVTKEGGGRRRGAVLAEGGSLALFRGRGQIAGGLGEDRLTYSAGLSHLNISEGLDGDDDGRNTSVQGRLRYRISPTAALSARIYATDGFMKLNEQPQAVGNPSSTGIIDARPLSPEEVSRYEAGTGPSQLKLGDASFIPSSNDPDYSRDIGFASTVLTFEHHPGESLGYTIRYHGLTSNRTYIDGPGGVSFEPLNETRLNFDGSIHTLNARADTQWGSHHFLTAAYELESESFQHQSFADDPAENSAVDVTQWSNSFYLQDQLRFLDGALQISGAFQTQVFSLDAPQFMPAVATPFEGIGFEAPPVAYTGDGSVAYFFRDHGTKLRAHVGNGYRAPSLFERFGSFYGTYGYSVFGDPLLPPERSIAVDVGLDQDLAAKRLRASATFFYTRLLEVIVFDFSGAIDPATDPYGRFGGYRTADGGRARGLELGVTAAASSSLHLALAYTWTNADPRPPYDEQANQDFVIPEHQFSFVATQRLGRDFYVNFELNAADEHLAPVFDPLTFTSQVFRFDAVVKADLGASYSLGLSGSGSLRFFGKIENLFDRPYFESGFRTAGRTGFLGAAFEF